MIRRALLAAACTASGALLAACGPSASPDSAAPATDTASVTASTTSMPSGDPAAAAMKSALRDTFVNAVASGSLPIPLDEAGATCAATAIVDKLGVATISRLGLASDGAALTMSPTEAVVAATALVDCSPNNGAVRTFQQRFNDGVGDGVSTTQKACLDKAISRQAVIDVLAAEFSDRSAAGQAAFKKHVTDVEPGCGVH